MECSSALILRMGLAVLQEAGLTDRPHSPNHDRKKSAPSRKPFFASVVTDEGRGNQRQYRRAEVAML